jgi:hypothetical protein
MIKNLTLVMSSLVMFGVVACATDEAAPSDDDAKTSETTGAATQCWSSGSAVRDGACGTILAVARPGNSVTVLGTPFASTCDGNLWVAVNFAGLRGDMRWESLCN